MAQRTCIITGETDNSSNLIRFVISPDGSLTPDLAEKLPGRGAYLPCRSTARHHHAPAAHHLGGAPSGGAGEELQRRSFEVDQDFGHCGMTSMDRQTHKSNLATPRAGWLQQTQHG